MTLEFKSKLANLTISIISITVALVVLWFVVFLLSNTFDLNVFAERTSEFFYIFLFAALAIVVCAAFLNISLNVGLIADVKMREGRIEHSTHFNKQVFFAFGGVLVLVIAFLFIGDQLSRRQEKERLLSECKDLITRYQKSVDDISVSLSDSSKVKNIPTILEFLSSQKSDYNDIAVITPTEFSGQMTFLRITTYMKENAFSKPYFNSAFYRCKERDTKYLLSVFKDHSYDPFVWSEKNDHYLYYPIISNSKCFVLHFSKTSRYGKIGS